MAAKTKTKEEKEDKKVLGTKEFTEQFFKTNKATLYNLEEEAEEYLVSTGSLILDSKIGGGLGSGVHRFVGVTEGGKTSAALEVMRNFLKTIPNSKGLYVKAEGRLSDKVRKRSGLKFTKLAEEWDANTCLIFETNIYDTCFDYLRGLLKHNHNKEKFCIIVDSMDGLLSLGDLEKSTSDAAKVAAGAVMTSDFLKRVSLGMSKFGHMCIMTSQQRSKISLDPYAKQDNNNTTQSSGGNAAMHYPDWILEFQRAFKADKILDKPDAPLGPDNKQYGHMAKVMVCKSTNETTGETVKYPIKYGRTDGTSVWIEREVADLLLMWGFFEKGGAGWFTTDSELIEHVKKSGKEFPEKIQGMKNIYALLENDNELFLVLKEFALANCAGK
jgi:hypothetical protein